MPDPQFRFSVTIYTEIEGVVYCLRGLAYGSQKRVNRYTPWRGTGIDDWKEAGNRVTFRFTEARFRESMLEQALQLLPKGAWREVSRSDDNPPPP